MRNRLLKRRREKETDELDIDFPHDLTCWHKRVSAAAYLLAVWTASLIGTGTNARTSSLLFAV